MFKNSLFSKIVLIFTIPVLGILYFSFITVMEKVDTLNDFKKNEIRIDYLKETQNVILSLEKEKILSLDFIKDSSKLDALLEQQNSTNQKIIKFNSLDDTFDFINLESFAPNTPLQIQITHSDGTTDTILANHTYNEQQIGWFRAGSALNLIAEEAKNS